MNKIKQLCALTLLIGSMGTLFGTAARDMTISPMTACVGNVTGTCTITVAAAEVGDVVPFDTTGVPTEKLGDISAEKSGQIAVPSVDKKQIISFVPQGDTPFKGQEIKLLLASFDVNKLPADADASIKNNVARMKKAMGDNAKTMVSAYRQLPGEDKWTEFGATGTPLTNLGEAVPINYTVMPNGQFDIKIQFQLKGTQQTQSWSASLGKIG